MAKNKAKRAQPRIEIAGRITRCRRAMKKHGVDAYLLSKQADGYYMTGFTGEDSAILLTSSEVHVISDGRFDEALNQECPWARRWMRKGMLNDEIAKACRELKIKSLAVQEDRLTVADHAQIRKAARGTRLTSAPNIVGDMRIAKDESELKIIRKAIRIAEDAFQAMREQLRTGMTEHQLAAILEFEMKSRGASGPSFPTIVAEGPNAALPHAHPGKRKVKAGSAILFDWGARFQGYCSDLTRVLFVGSIPDKIGKIYRHVLEAQQLAIRALKPGERMCDVDAVARDYIKSVGFGDEFNHGLGHGVGLDIHEAPSLSWRSDAPLAVDMVVTVEPGIYLPGVGGVRIEDDVLMTPGGSRVLSRLSKRLDDAVIR